MASPSSRPSRMSKPGLGKNWMASSTLLTNTNTLPLRLLCSSWLSSQRHRRKGTEVFFLGDLHKFADEIAKLYPGCMTSADHAVGEIGNGVTASACAEESSPQAEKEGPQIMQHSLLGASGASRWLNCPGSFRHPTRRSKPFASQHLCGDSNHRATALSIAGKRRFSPLSLAVYLTRHREMRWRRSHH